MTTMFNDFVYDLEHSVYTHNEALKITNSTKWGIDRPTGLTNSHELTYSLISYLVVSLPKVL